MSAYYNVRETEDIQFLTRKIWSARLTPEFRVSKSATDLH